MLFWMVVFVTAWLLWARMLIRSAVRAEAQQKMEREVEREHDRAQNRRSGLAFRSKFERARRRPDRATRRRSRRPRPWAPTAESAPASGAPETKPAGEPDLYFGWK